MPNNDIDSIKIDPINYDYTGIVLLGIAAVIGLTLWFFTRRNRVTGSTPTKHAVFEYVWLAFTGLSVVFLVASVFTIEDTLTEKRIAYQQFELGKQLGYDNVDVFAYEDGHSNRFIVSKKKDGIDEYMTGLLVESSRNEYLLAPLPNKD